MPARGFTLVELIAVILIAGIMAAVAAPRFLTNDTIAADNYRDDVATFLRYAQKLAIARHTNLYVQADSTGLTLCTGSSSCQSAVAGPDGSSSYQALAPSGVSLDGSGKSFSFDDLGRPLCSGLVCASSTTFVINADPTLTLTVEAETGYVH